LFAKITNHLKNLALFIFLFQGLKMESFAWLRYKVSLP